MKIVIEILSLAPLVMMSPETKQVANFYANYNSAEKWINTELKPDQEFFTGPRIHSLSIDERISIKKKHCDLTNNFFKISDGFILFDYPEILFTKDVTNDSGGADYFKIQDGKVIYGGYDHIGNGGEQTLDLESVYYWPESLFDLLTNQRYTGTQKEVQEIMRKYIVAD